ncbi:hybrid sensor histidine kinase/response regulator [Neorhodopirellula pilleata]|uniref:histidine kinase n=1 Tax=Neorhodopirellula pilleata TaxID=2714738 RepID=A0A5C6AA53_9BACT|nr:chemotaxis protein CheW [Neorhodopirellula pilleata]TWT96237.1 Chemotaxis protein CheA [Neorhodopirellula pilleata]
MDDSELLVEFVEEAREHLGDIEIQLLQIEAMGADIDANLVNTVFRAIHSVKGAAGFLGLSQINAVSHRLEDVLNRIRDRVLIPDPFNVDVMLKAADRLKTMIESIETSNETDNSAICQKLDEILTGQIGGVSHAGEAEAETEPAAEAESKPRRRKTKRADVAAKAAAEVDSESSTKNKPTRRSGSAAQPNTPSPKSRSRKRAATSDVSVAARASETLDVITDNMADVEKPAPAPVAPLATKPPAVAESAAADSKPADKMASDPTIRVGVRVLDRLMNLAGELVLGRNQLVQAVNAQSSSRNADQRRNDSKVARNSMDVSSKLDSIAANLDQVTTELQEAIMQTRMQPIGNVFNKFPRVIRDLSASLGKQITLRTEGNEVETDKTIIEAIADPLTHLVRNSCDHGVETPDVRVAAGKPANGTVVLKAYHQAGKVMIEIVDDGAGINPEKLKAKALEKGIIDAQTAAKMSDREAVNLIFAPGFSTAAAITAVSGRGVGMDVVRTNIEKIGGSVEVHSTLGKGSTVHITLPLTLAIVPSMIVSVGGRPYALPQSGIVELVQTDGKEKCIQTASSAEVLRLRGQLLPLIRMNDILSCSDSVVSADRPDPNDCQLVVFESGRHRFALAVDRVLDSEEIVVKPLGRHLSNLPLMAGSTILGDGRVALILDAAGIAARISLRKDSEPDAPDELETQAVSVDRQRLVLLSTSAHDRFAVSMDIVSRIERVDVNKIEKIGNEKLLQYRGTTLPLLSIDDVATVTEMETTDHVYVVVFRVYGHEVGLIAPHLHDIRDCDLSAGVQNSTERGVAGIAVIDNLSTRLLDLYGMTEIVRPDWFERPEEVPSSGPARLLVCEDSAFFRTFLIKTLKEVGHQVTACIDGELGWTELDQHPHDYDLLLTDVEMPNLDGFELTRRVRADSRFKRLPIIALTSLADDESNRIGRAAGVSDYQVKMNKPDLLASIHQLVGHARCQKKSPSSSEKLALEAHA